MDLNGLPLTKLSSATWQRVLQACLIGSAATLLLFGVVGVGRSGTLGGDFTVLHDAGQDWLAGRNPYVDNHLPFAYPSNFSFYAVPLALLPLSVAKYGMVLVSLGWLAALLWLARRVLDREAGRDVSATMWLLVAIFLVGNPFTAHNFWMGQTSLLVLAPMMGSWLFAAEGRRIASGVLLGLASIKPHLVLLLVIWYLLEFEWKILLTAGATFLLMSFLPMVTQGPVTMMQDWIQDGILGYLGNSANHAGFQHLIGLKSMLEAAGMTPPSLTLAGVALTAVFWFYRSNWAIFDRLAIILGLSMTFVYGHDYEYVCILPALIALLIWGTRNPQVWLWLAVLVGLMFIPQRLIRIADMPVLNHWRTPVVMAMTGLLIWLNWKAKRIPAAQAAGLQQGVSVG
jgi:hypothetical protein